MKKVQYKASERGHADHGWLNAHHYFSFAGYNDPQKVHFGMLRVLNDDVVQGGMGFGTHPHDNMEIITIPLEGSLEHKDSMGNQGVIQPGEVQVMSAGTGIMHSEFNHEKERDTKLFQVWLFPNRKNVEPRYDQKDFSKKDRLNKFITLVSPDGADNSMWIYQDAWFSLGKFDAGKAIPYSLKKKGNGVFVLVVEGKAELDGETLGKRDAVGVSETDSIEIKAKEASEILLIEVPMN